MNESHRLIILISSILFTTVFTIKCPPPKVINPCTCVGYMNQISCWNIKEGVNLRHVFKNLTRFMESHQIHKIAYDEFKLFDSELSEIGTPTNGDDDDDDDDDDGDIFSGVTFHKINIMKNLKLKRIHRNAFLSSANITTSITITENPILGNDPPHEREIFDLLNKFINAREITLTDNNITVVPENAFKHLQPSLAELSLIDNNIVHIGHRAFWKLPNLKYLLLDSNLLDHIQSGSFELPPNPAKINETLRLYLRDNGLSAESFESGSLAKIRRKLLLDLSKNNITHLPKKVFAPLFRRSGSAVILRSNPLRCDCRFKWLYERKLLYNSSDPNQHYYVRGVHCNDNTRIKMTELLESDFTHCPDDKEEEFDIEYADDDDDNDDDDVNRNSLKNNTLKLNNFYYSSLQIMINFIISKYIIKLSFECNH